MPEEQHSGDNDGVQLPIPPPLDEDPLATDYRLAREKSLLWRGLSDDERDIVIAGEITLSAMRRRTLSDWLQIGQSIELLENEVMRQAGTEATTSPRYRRAWRQLAPDQISQMVQANRSNAKWLWRNRDAVQTWWATIQPDKRDRWGHPATIKIQYEHDHPPEVNGLLPLPEDDVERPRTPFPSASHGEVLARGIERLDVVTDRVSDELGGTVSHITRIVREYDLSTEDTAFDAARAFWATYAETYGPEGVQRFIDALQTTLHSRSPLPPQNRFRRRN